MLKRCGYLSLYPKFVLISNKNNKKKKEKRKTKTKRQKDKRQKDKRQKALKFYFAVMKQPKTIKYSKKLGIQTRVYYFV